MSKNKIPKDLVKYIEIKNDFFYVKRKFNDGIVKYGKFNSLDKALAAVHLLIKHNWKLIDVEDDPLINYGGKFWIFQVIDKKLVVDETFSDFEAAVEHLEINSKCNDYHNDIFKDSLNNKASKGNIENSKEVSVKDEKHIFKKSDKFLVKKSSRVNAICVGEFDSLDVAIAARRIALDSKWRISNGHEITFYNDYYWAFEISDGILSFKGKSGSYDDALDFIDPIDSHNGEKNPFLDSLDKNYEKFVAKKKAMSNKSNSKTFESKNISSTNSKNVEMGCIQFNKTKFRVDISKIWNPFVPKKYDNQKLNLNVFRSGERKLLFELAIIISDNDLVCKVNGEMIDWNNRYHYTEFSEFKLIIDILELNQFNLLKLENSSSIHYYKGYYYKILLLDGNKIILDKFVSYTQAEKATLEFGRNSLKQLNLNHSLDIDKVRGNYELVKIQRGNVLKINPLKSLEEMKAIRDILIISDWDLKIFDKYELFYLHGLYWEIFLSNNIIYLLDKYESIQTKK